MPAGESLDALSGDYRLFQLKDGHRFSTDDVLTAWYGSSVCARADRVLDLGSGIGSVGMIAAWRLPGARFTTIEAQSESVRLARKSAAYNGLEERYRILEGDIRDEAVLANALEGARAGGDFDLVLGSPPYFALDAGVTAEHPQKIACRFETRGTVADYCRAAARTLGAGGVFACVFPIDPPAQLERVVTGAREAGLVILRRRAIVLKEGAAPLLSLFAMMREGDLPEPMRSRTLVEPEIIIRRADGTVHPEYSVIKLSFGFPP